jgi:HAD superfamily hydrolase (TIGR01509 family)
MIKAIFFDSNGVLIIDNFKKAIADFEISHNLTKNSLFDALRKHQYWKDYTLGMISEGEYFRQTEIKLNSKLDLPLLKTAIYKSLLPNKEVVEFAKTLKDKYFLGIICNNPKEWFEYFWNSYGFKNIFSLNSISSDLHIRKPAREIFQDALNKAKVSGTESIYIDDRIDRVQGAIESGIKIINFTNLEQLKSDLNNLL